jgi:hypothetical protein
VNHLGAVYSLLTFSACLAFVDGGSETCRLLVKTDHRQTKDKGEHPSLLASLPRPLLWLVVRQRAQKRVLKGFILDSLENQLQLPS